MAVTGIDYSCFACATTDEQQQLDECLAQKQTLESRLTNIDTTLTEVVGRNVGDTPELKASTVLSDKNSIKTALEAKKGSALANPDDLSTYDDEITALGDYSEWGRPTEWLKIEHLVDLNNEQKAVMLYLIRDDVDYDSIAFTVVAETANTITIDWGDGIVDSNLANGKHIHDYDHASINSQLTAEGYKQCIVTVTASSNITRMVFYNQTNSQAERSISFVDGIFSIPHITTASDMFKDVYKVKSIVVGDLLACTSTYRMFRNIIGIVNLEIGNMPEATNISQMFYILYTLKKLKVGSHEKAENCSTTFYGLYSIQSLNIKKFPLNTNAYKMFDRTYNCTDFTLEEYNNDITIRYIGLSRTKLVELFNNLENVTDKTITITGARGASGLSDDDIAIATNKGWTVTN